MRLVLLQLGFLIQGFLATDPLINNGYRNVIVSIHPDITVDANSQKTIITNIKVRKTCEMIIHKCEELEGKKMNYWPRPVVRTTSVLKLIH